MASDHRLLALVGALLISTWAGHAAADDAPTPDPEPRNGFSAKVLTGPSYHSLYGHHIGGAMLGISLGAQFKDVGAVHGTFAFQRGWTDAGLGTRMYMGSVTYEHIIGPVRPGIGLLVRQLEMERITSTSDLEHFAPGLTSSLTVDIVRSSHANFFVGLHGDLSLLPNDDLLPGLWLGIGGRFKVP